MTNESKPRLTIVFNCAEEPRSFPPKAALEARRAACVLCRKWTLELCEECILPLCRPCQLHNILFHTKYCATDTCTLMSPGEFSCCWQCRGWSLDQFAVYARRLYMMNQKHCPLEFSTVGKIIYRELSPPPFFFSFFSRSNKTIGHSIVDGIRQFIMGVPFLEERKNVEKRNLIEFIAEEFVCYPRHVDAFSVVLQFCYEFFPNMVLNSLYPVTMVHDPSLHVFRYITKETRTRVECEISIVIHVAVLVRLIFEFFGEWDPKPRIKG